MSALLRQIMLDSPLGYWPLDDKTGTTAKDRSGNGRDGTYGGTFTLANAAVIPGAAQVVTLGSNGYVNLGNLAAWDLLGSDWTIEAWIKMTAARSDHREMARRDAGSGQTYALRVNTSGKLEGFNIGSGGTLDVVSNAVVDDGNLHHVASVHSGTSMLLYIDGALDNSGTAASGGTNGGVLYAGSYTATGEYLNGPLASLAVFGTALAADRIASHFKAGRRGGDTFG